MRLTEQNYPLLRFLKWGDDLTRHPSMRKTYGKGTQLPFLGFQDAEYIAASRNRRDADAFVIRKSIFEEWPGLQPAFSSNIEILSRTFLFALERSYGAFLNPDIFSEITGERGGTLILPDGSAICYAFEMTDPHRDGGGRLRYGIAGDVVKVDRDGNRLVAAGVGGRAYDARRARFFDRDDEDVMGLFDLVLVCALFKRYADVQTVDAKSIRRPKEDEPEVKTTLDGIRYLDASWYTTIVRTEGFGVRGHFRLQPCGAGRKEKKLIYINEFRKHGYVRRAKLLQED